LTPALASPLSFRDPDATLVKHDGRLIRAVRGHALDSFRRMLDDPLVRRWMDDGRIVRTRPLSRIDSPPQFGDFGGECFEHERIPFVSQPAEWAPEMLAAAASFTLGLSRALLPHGWQLKDATPANVLFRDSEPVFADLPSIVPREPGGCLWIARHQFETTFLLPLIASVEAGLPIAWMLANPVAGLSHEALARILGARRWIKPRLWRTVALPAALAAQAARGTTPRGLKGLERRAGAVHPGALARGPRAPGGPLRFAAAGAEFALASLYVDARALRQRRPGGQVSLRLRRSRRHATAAHTRYRREHRQFSEIAARAGEVVALDIDERSIAAIWARARAGKLPILPLVGNFGRPMPALGWRNREFPSLLGRAAGSFNLVLMLAVVHHLRVTEGVPVAEQFDAVGAITRRHLLVEFVPVTDPMFAALARGREPLYGDCERLVFEATLLERFQVERRHELPNGRVLYLARKRSA